ncbi:hypothetical protein [Lysinibacillus sphaericus]|uniref:hypothetical protein n=1 Tax=Lysinibacillus sphaericus TaxID=1421 RepID=UPI000C185CD4|nr:hypothetical protein [Lysinibacillus sphaericus]PIJ98047.1 hypothetical protein CTN02_09905 [Lysinibacillus sphaericus]
MRVNMVWSGIRQQHSKEIYNILWGTIRVSEGTHCTLFYFEGECVNLNDVRKIFTYLQRNNLFCRSIKLFETGSIPRMEKYGFTHNGMFYILPLHDISLLAIPYGNQEWCLQLDKRSGSGIDLEMLQAFPYFQETFRQLSLEELSSI